jgi:hypothetical protein
MKNAQIIVICALASLLSIPGMGQSTGDWDTYKRTNGIDLSWTYNEWVAAGMPHKGGGSTGSSGGAGTAGIPDRAEQLGHQLGTALGNQLTNALFGNKSGNGPSQAQFQQGQMEIAAQQLNNTGLWYLRQKDYPSAINEFQQALARAPNDQSIAANLAIAQQQYGLTQSGAAEAARVHAASNRPPGMPSIALAVPDPNGDQSGQSQANDGSGKDAGSKQGTTGGADNPAPTKSDSGSDGGAAQIDAEFGKLYNESTATPQVASESSGSAAAQAQPAIGPGGAGAAGTSPLAQELNTSPGGVGKPDFDGNSGGNAALGKANPQGASTGTPAFGDANSTGLSPDAGDASVVDLRGKAGIVDPSALTRSPQAASSPDTGTASVEPPPESDFHSPGVPGVIGTPKAVDPLTIPGSSGLFLPRSPVTVKTAMAPPVTNPLLDAMYASASSYEPGKDATPNYKFIKAFTFKPDGVDAVLYGEWNVDLDGMTLPEIDKQRPVRLILAFRGTDDLMGWVTNARNTYGHSAPEFEAARIIARAIRSEYHGIPILLTGHSLGGGEAALASFSTGLPAITFNAEGVRPSDYGYNSGIGSSQISNYFILAEPLTTSQAISYGYGKVTGNELSSMALQVGNQIPLFPVTKPSIANRGNHSMIAVEPAVLNFVSVVHP